jgi:Flp pilus assembly protein TadD
MNRKERRASAKQLRSSRGKAPDQLDAIIQQAIALVNNGNLAQAETLLTDLRKSAPDDPEAKHQLGMIYVRTGRSEAGQDLLRQAVEVRPNEPIYWNNLAAAYLSVEMSEQAADAARRAATINPRYGEAWQNLGLALRDLRKHGEASDAFEQADASGTLAVFSLGSWAECLGALRRFPEAERTVRRGLEQAPEDAFLLTLLGWIHAEQRRDDEAREEFHRSLGLNPNQFLAAFNYGVLLLKTPDISGALRWLRRATSIESRSGAAWRVLAMELARHGHDAEALPAAERALRLVPGDPALTKLVRRLKGEAGPGGSDNVFDFSDPTPIGPAAEQFPEPKSDKSDPAILDFSTINFGD